MSWGKDQYGLVKIWINRPCDGYYLRWWYNGWHYWWFLPGTVSFETEGEDYYTLGTQKIAMSSGQITYGQCQAIRTILNAVDVDIWTDVGWKSTRLERDSVIVYDNKVNGYEIEFVMILGSRHISETGYSPIIIIPPVVPPVWTLNCTNGNCTIGTQVWSSCNYDIAYPGSRVYDDDEGNRILLGGLYTWNQVMASGFVPTGWHIPTEAEWNTLITNLGGVLVAGGSLKDSGTTYWNSPNSVVSPVSCFDARAGGYFHSDTSTYEWIGERGIFWTASDTPANGRYVLLAHEFTTVVIGSEVKDHFFSVRLIRDTPATILDTGYGALYNWYAVIGQLVAPGLGYGALYNWYAVSNALFAPAGWHVPTQVEWYALFLYLDPDGVYDDNSAGGNLKEEGTLHWESPNQDADNITNFSAFGSGSRSYYTGGFSGINKYTYYWNQEEINPADALISLLYYDTGFFNTSGGPVAFYDKKSNGFPVRFIKDDSTLADCTDNDGNVVPAVKIGTQVWTSENCKQTKYNDGSAIPNITNDALWAADTTGAYCWYDNDINNA